MIRNRNCSSTVLVLLLTAGAVSVNAQSAPPIINANGVVEGASFSQRVVAGGLATIFGSNLAASAFAAAALPLPTTLGGVTVRLNGELCPLLYVSPSQINFQVRWAALSLTSAPLVVTTATGSSNTYTVALSPVAPGVFAVGMPGQGAILISNTSTFAAHFGSIPGANARPATAGEYISIYCSGLGDVINRPADGTASPVGPNLATIKAPIQVGIDTQFSIPVFAGMAPGFVGLYQVDVKIPPGVRGPVVPVTVIVNGVFATTVAIAFQ